MNQKRNYKGLKKYEALLKIICRIEDCNAAEEKDWAKFFGVKWVSLAYKKNDYYELNDSEWEGCLGISCVISVIEGVVPNIFSLSKHLDIPHYDVHLQQAFERLKVNGVLSNRFSVRTDPALTGNAEKNRWQAASEVERNAWCMIAGVAGGQMGMGEQEKREGTEEKKVDPLPVLTLGE